MRLSEGSLKNELKSEIIVKEQLIDHKKLGRTRKLYIFDKDSFRYVSENVLQKVFLVKGPFYNQNSKISLIPLLTNSN